VLFKRIPILFFLFTCSLTGFPQKGNLPHINETGAGEAWSGNSINTVVFRKNSLTSFNGTQFISYYDAEGFVVLGKRILGQPGWELKKTRFRGNIADAHNSISIVLDGEGYLHMAWDLNYLIPNFTGCRMGACYFSTAMVVPAMVTW
jgi:hypothetical protein